MLLSLKCIAMNTKEEKEFWTRRYKAGNTGWDIGYPSTPLKAYFDQLEDKNLRILIPGAGNAYEAEYLHQKGFTNVYVLDVSPHPLEQFKNRVAGFPKAHLICENFFEHNEKYDLIMEQTFFCSFLPSIENRNRYAKKMSELLLSGGKLMGLWFEIPLVDNGKRPFGGTRAEYLGYLDPYFDIQVFEPAINSIKPRAGKELFGLFVKR